MRSAAASAVSAAIVRSSHGGLARREGLVIAELCQRRARGARLLPPTSPEQDDRDRLEHDAQIFLDRPAADVLQVVAHLHTNVIHRAVVLAVDLCEPGDAGLGPLTQGVFADLAPQAGKDLGPLRPRADDVHVAPEYVEKL